MSTIINSITIEKADNGYIVHENFHFKNPMDREPHASGHKVYETMSALNKYIADNLKIESNDQSR